MPKELMRYTIIDRSGGASFIAAASAITAMMAACSQNPQSLNDFLDTLEPLYGSLREYVLNGLAVFDEANVPGNYASIHTALREFDVLEQPVFRIVDETTRETSLQPYLAGAVVFNLRAKRIIQLANTFQELKRSGRGRVVDDGRVTNRIFTYRLPAEWSLVP